MTEIRQALSTACLVTLTGTGGAGKTRVALQIAADLLPQYPDGAWLVDVALLSDPTLVPSAVVSVLGVPEEPGRSILEILVEYLRTKTLLLVLDNCEHLLAACAELVEGLLRECPALKILATSREGLGVTGENLYVIPSLSVPDVHQTLPLEQVVLYEAVQLFAQRSAASVPGFKVTQRNAHAVVRVCRRLDGIPLAIELAAARMRALSVDEIVSRLDDRFRLLTGGRRTSLARHQTLRAAMDWSYGLLQEDERLLLRSLSVFIGGWTLEIAEAVCSGDGVASSDVLDLLTRLVDKSLVLVDERDGQGRYRLLETVRQYGGDRLLESGEAELVRLRHRDAFLALAASAQKYLAGPDQASWLEHLEAEHDNLRAALDWSLANNDATGLLELVKGLYEFWSIRCYWSECLKWLDIILFTTRGQSSPLRAWALWAAGATARRLGHNERAVAHLEEAAEMCRALDDKKGLAESLRALGLAKYRLADYRRAERTLQEAMATALELDDKPVLASARYLLGVVARLRGDYDQAQAHCEASAKLSEAMELKRWAPPAFALDGLGLIALCRGDCERARALCERALALHQREGYRSGIIASLNSLALIACVRGDYERAVALCNECLVLSRTMGDRPAIARTLNVLGRVAFHQGDLEQAAAQHRQSLALFQEIRETLGTVQCLERLAITLSAEGEQPIRLFAAAERMREEIGAVMPSYERADYDPAVASASAAVNPAALADAQAAGRAMTLEQAVDHALQSRES